MHYPNNLCVSIASDVNTMKQPHAMKAPLEAVTAAHAASWFNVALYSVVATVVPVLFLAIAATPERVLGGIARSGGEHARRRSGDLSSQQT